MPVNIKGKSYKTVWERLSAARGEAEELPQGITQIDTEVVATNPLLVVRATVWFTNGTKFSGLSEAKLDAAANTADGTNPVECAETSAVGRALAFAGYSGSEDGIAGAEEVRAAQRRQETPSSRNGGPQPREFGEAVAAGHVPEATAPEDALGVARGHFRAMAQRALKMGEDVMPATEMVKLNLNQLRDAFKELRTRVEAAERRGIPAER